MSDEACMYLNICQGAIVKLVTKWVVMILYRNRPTTEILFHEEETSF